MQNEKIEESEITLKVSEEPSPVADALPAVVSEPPPAVQLHGILHSMKKANCSTQWKNMVGDDRVRQCKVCKVNAYQMQGLDGKELLDLIADKEPDSVGAEMRLFRRDDGAVMLRPGFCAKRLRATLIASILLGALAAFAGENSYMTISNLLLMASLCALLFGIHINARRVLKPGRTAKATMILFFSIILALAMESAMPRNWGWSFWKIVPGLFGLIGWLYFCVALLMDGMQKMFDGIRGKHADGDNKDAPLEPSANALAAQKRNGAIAVGLLGLVTAIIGYCIADGWWCVKLLTASMYTRTDEAAISNLEPLLATLSGERADVVRLCIGTRANASNQTEKAKLQFRAAIADLAGKQNQQLAIWSHQGLAKALFHEKNLDEADAEATRSLQELAKPGAEKGGVPVFFGFYYPMAPAKFVPYATRESYKLLAEIKEAKRDFPGADACYEKLVHPVAQEDHDYWPILDSLRTYVDYLQRNGRNDDAVKVTRETAKRVEALAPDYMKGYSLGQIARAYEHVHDPLAEETLARRVHIEDQHPYAEVNPRLEYATYLARMKKFDKADVLFLQAIERAKSQQKILDQVDRVDRDQHAFNNDLFRAYGLRTDSLLARGDYAQAAAVVRDMDKMLNLHQLGPREKYKFFGRYKTALQKVDGPGATKYDTALKELLKEEPKAADPGYEDDLW